MSVRLMSAVWDLDLPASDKIVLLALADNANDDGLCWPGMAHLVAKCSKGERTIQASIKRLVKLGHLTRNEILGKGCRYTVHPRNNCAPAENAPPQVLTQTPAESAGKPSRTINNNNSKRASHDFPKPDWADAGVWRDLLVNRKSKGTPNTPTAHKLFISKVEAMVDDDWPPGKLVEAIAANGWAGAYDPRPSQPKNTNRTDRKPYHDRQPANCDEIQNPMARVVAQRQADRLAAER